MIPHLATFSDWEAFARESPSCPFQLTLMTDTDGDNEPYDPLAVYWQTLCTGILPPDNDTYTTSFLFYSWRASLKAIFQLRRWRLDGLLRPLALVGYLRRTWRGYSEFVALLEHVYERRLGRGADGCLVLLPGEAKVGDGVALCRGGRVPLVMRRGNSEGDSGGEGRWYTGLWRRRMSMGQWMGRNGRRGGVWR